MKRYIHARIACHYFPACLHLGQKQVTGWSGKGAAPELSPGVALRLIMSELYMWLMSLLHTTGTRQIGQRDLRNYWTDRGSSISAALDGIDPTRASHT
jgi:hypothetical protein